MEYREALALLKAHHQEQVLRFWDELNDREKAHLLDQIARIDFDNLEKLIALTRVRDESAVVEMTEAPVIKLSERAALDKKMRKTGEQALSRGEVAVFLVAGGQGSRLGFEGPKGIFPVTPVKNKSLFQLHAEKIRARATRYGCVIPWYIMTSQSNHDDTIRFFRENRFFGLSPADVMFFRQEMLPSVDAAGKLILAEKHALFMSPNGHGGSLKALWDSGAVADMKGRGIKYLFYFQVDNVLTKIGDPEFIGYHIDAGAEMSNKVVHKAYPEEKMGVICKMGDRLGVVEYSDMSDEQMQATGEDGQLKYWAGSIAIHIINVSFLEKENDQGFRLPYHVAHKQIPYVDEEGRKVVPAEKNGFKFETFVFDALQHTERILSLEVERAEEFSALKNGSGVDSPATARRDLNLLYARWLEQAGIGVPRDKQGLPAGNIEISPLFADEAGALLAAKKRIPSITFPFYLE